MRMPYQSIVTMAATLVVLASAASFAVDPSSRLLRDSGLERTVTLADMCGGSSCSIAYKTDEGGPPSSVVPAR